MSRPCNPMRRQCSTSSSQIRAASSKAASLRSDTANSIERAAHAAQRPGQIVRRGPSGEERALGGVETRIRRIRTRGKRKTIGGGCTDEWRAAHGHGANRARGLLDARQLQYAELERQPRLIDDAHGPLGRRPDGPIMNSGDVHRRARQPSRKTCRAGARVDLGGKLRSKLAPARCRRRGTLHQIPSNRPHMVRRALFAEIRAPHP